LKLEAGQFAGLPVHLVVPHRFTDDRGWFAETWNRRTWLEQGIDVDFVQENHSLSLQAATLRGLHLQTPPRAQAKLVRVLRGRINDVTVDVRVGSPTFGQWCCVELSAENGRQLLIPVGFLHGFVTLEPDTEVLYKCSDYYAPECEVAVRFDDPDIGIDWMIGRNGPTLSARDAAAMAFGEFDSPFQYQG
jgi:dTDP-4-dehydrorhamnose 3,5-epimerase